LVRRPLLATCPEKVCAVCGMPWQRSMQRQQGRLLAIGPLRQVCGCRGDRTAVSQPGVVLDPFLGSGTVALAAEQYVRDWIGIELNPTYAALAERRIHDQRTVRQNSGKKTSKES
ncbi:MAG: site-specific DNA-methyltransferase, partial [Actinobacteria bacterium]|nr:site-specific DNA-methyltransferase [Actinomycetota bacterium]